MEADQPEMLIPNDRNHQIDELFPRIPDEILFSIFNVTDNIGLVHLASINHRYEPIAREVFEKRYVDKYFVIEGDSEQQRQQHFAQLSEFGDIIRAIEVKNIQQIDEDHWLSQLLRKHTPNIQKFCFQKCSFKSADELFSRHTELTQLTFRGGSCEGDYKIHLPEYHHLKALELTNCRYISKPSLQQILRNNPQMECLIMRNCDIYFTLSEIMNLVRNHLHCLRELNLLDCYEYNIPLPSLWVINAFSNSLEYLESFAMTIVRKEAINLLPHLSANCSKLKSLELHNYVGFLTDEVIRKICALDKSETLSLIGFSYQDQIESIIEQLPHLRFLTLSRRRTNSEIFSIFRKCNTLEQLTFDSENIACWIGDCGDNDEEVREYKFNVLFHDEFLQIIRNPHTRIEFTDQGQKIGHITKEVIVWKNKLLHWIGYNPATSQSKLQLLDLANIPKDTKARHKQPLNLIFNYLDLNCLYAFSRANNECKQLVHGYIFQRCKQLPKNRGKKSSMQRGKILLTNEFGMNSDALRMFGKCINNLDLIRSRDGGNMSHDLETYCKKLTKLCVRTYTGAYPPDFILPQVRHYLYYGYQNEDECRSFCDLSELACKCPNLEMLEFKTPMEFGSSWTRKYYSFCDLKLIKFKPKHDSDVEFVMNFFKNTDTKVIVDH